MLKSHACGSLREEHIGQEVTLAGWVHRRRDHGGLIFLDLRDREGLVQVVFNPETALAAHDTVEQVRLEYVLQVEGVVQHRPSGTENPRLASGAVEVAATAVRVLNAARTPPFAVNEDADVDEPLRLRYRYLDLRRARMRDNLILRHNVTKFIRDFLDARGFLEIETPMLIKSTPEGARDYLVPSRLYPGHFYALPQSPQQLKQLLMVAGLDRYYQIARCFRDEDQRADRQPEFTQLDLEMSFVEMEDVLAVTEGLFTTLVPAVAPQKRLISPFPRLTYNEAMLRYGSDKPDLRFGLEISDLSDLVPDSSFAVFRSALEAGGVVRGVRAPGCAGYSRRQVEELTDLVRARGAAGLITIALGGESDRGRALSDLSSEQVRSQAARFLPWHTVLAMGTRLDAAPGDLLCLVAGPRTVAEASLGALRLDLGERLGLADPNLLAFAFITGFPLLEWNAEEHRWDAVHHPFCAVEEEDLALLGVDPGRARAKSYDLVANGYELASGSIRIHQRALQESVFRVMGYDGAEMEERFGHLLEAFDYGAPPHGGIAPGIDRLVQLLAGERNIREVMAFPKTQAAQDLLFGAPAPVTEAQLAELHLRLRS